VVGGRFNVLLGDSAINQFSALSTNASAYLEITVGTNTPISPRQQILSAPYALKAVSSDNLGGYTANAFWNAAGNAGTTPAANFVGTTDSQPLAFRVAGAEAMRISANGRIGIGTNNPLTPLHLLSPDADFQGVRISRPGKTNEINAMVAAGDYGYLDLGGGTTLRGGAGAGLGSTFGGDVQIGSPSARGALRVTGATPTGPDLSLEDARSCGHTYTLWSGGSGCGNFDIQDGTRGVMALTIRYDGNVGLGNVNPAFALDVSGSVHATSSLQANDFVSCVNVFASGNLNAGYDVHASGNLYFSGSSLCCSDIRYKTNVASIGDGLCLVQRLRGVRFDWRRQDFPEKRFGKERQLGFIAQEARSALPEVVKEDEQGFLSVDYAKVVPVLVEAIKEQQAQIEDKDKAVAELRKEVASLRAAQATSVADWQSRFTALEKAIARINRDPKQVNTASRIDLQD
jgi:hypothetical protein